MKHFLLLLLSSIASAEVLIGPFITRNHDVVGTVYALSERVLEIRGFTFDGAAPAAFFWADTEARPSRSGYLLHDAAGPSSSCGNVKLPGSRGATYTVEFPPGTSVLDVLGGSISVWCERFAANFGEVVVPGTLEELVATADGPALICSEGGGDAAPGPAPVEAVTAPLPLGSLTTRQHALQGTVVALSDRVLQVSGFTFDGNAPAAFFWADTGTRPSSSGFMLLDAAPTNSCGTNDLPRADGETYIVEFPEGTSLRDVAGGSIGVWCEAFNANFGEVRVPDDLSALPVTGPSLSCSENPTPVVETPDFAATPDGYNCESMHEDFQVRWKLDGSNINLQLLGRNLREGDYMSFGLSGSPEGTDMVGADVVVADLFQGEYRVIDFYMDARGQCSNGNGVCPDTFGNNAFASDITNVSGQQAAGLTMIEYTRPLVPTDLEARVGGQTVDLTIPTSGESFIAWAIGPVDDNTGIPFFHDVAFPRNDVSLEFGRATVDSCEPFVVAGPGEEEEEEIVPFVRPVLTDVTEFTARIGPSGGPRGYVAITEQDAWGISWCKSMDIPVVCLILDFYVFFSFVSNSHIELIFCTNHRY